jgi:hypothetical protein
MSVDPPMNPALDSFVQRMHKLRLSCGQPPLRKMEQVSAKVVVENKDRDQELPSLSAPTLSGVLNRHRKNPPLWPWVACYVLTCQRIAGRSRLEEDSTLRDWHRWWQALYHTQPATDDIDTPKPEPPESGDARSTLDDSSRAKAVDGTELTPYLEGPRHAGPPSDSATSPPGAAARAAVAELLEDYVGDPGGPTPSEQRFFKLYGQVGVRLFRAADDRRVAGAAYRLGVLLCLDDRPVESLAWLMQAESDGHGRASELIEEPHQRSAALSHAYDLGIHEVATGDDETAAVYLEAAARHGHARAAYELGTVYMEREQNSAHAAYWFAQAAKYGHPAGKLWADRNQEEAQWLVAPPTSALPARAERIVRVPTVEEN